MKLRSILLFTVILLFGINDVTSQVLIFKDAHRSGDWEIITESVCLHEGDLKSFQDKISSITVKGGYNVKVYKHIWASTCEPKEEGEDPVKAIKGEWSVSDPNDPWNDVISYIEITPPPKKKKKKKF